MFSTTFRIALTVIYPVQHFITEKFFIYAKEVRAIVLSQEVVIFNHSVMIKPNSFEKAFLNHILSKSCVKV